MKSHDIFKLNESHAESLQSNVKIDGIWPEQYAMVKKSRTNSRPMSYTSRG